MVRSDRWCQTAWQKLLTSLAVIMPIEIFVNNKWEFIVCKLGFSRIYL